MSGHTPTPWEDIGDDEPVRNVPSIEIAAGTIGKNDFKSIAYVNPTLDDASDCFVLTPEDRANAAFIVRAVNAHKNLLFALRYADQFVPAGDPLKNKIAATIAAAEDPTEWDEAEEAIQAEEAREERLANGQFGAGA